MNQPALLSLLNDARSLLMADRPEEAEAMLRPALAGNAGPTPTWQLLGLALRAQGRIEETRAIQAHIAELQPGNYVNRFDLAETLLLQGDFDRGWREYHYRYNLPHTVRLERKVQLPRWDGRPLAGQPILIHDEQGFGDTFQFLRLVPRVREAGGAVILQVHPAILPLAARMGGYDTLLAHGAPPPPFALHCEMLGLPLALRLTLDDLPGPIPYLSADPARQARWRNRLDPLPRPWVALVWGGQPTHLNDRNRSASLAALAPLAETGLTFLSLQKGARAAEAEAPPPGMTLVNLDPEIADFEDTAAILSIADLLISVDSSPIHLAGALGRPGWLMLPFVPDWRWLLERTDTPWYPSLRLYRQPGRGDWDAVARRIAQDLSTL